MWPDSKAHYDHGDIPYKCAWSQVSKTFNDRFASSRPGLDQGVLVDDLRSEGALFGPKNTNLGRVWDYLQAEDFVWFMGQLVEVGRVLLKEEVSELRCNEDMNEAVRGGQVDKMGAGLVKLAQEDPSFHFSRDEEINQTMIEGMGELHLEIIVVRLKREFKVEANVGAPQVHYRESISRTSEVRYVHKKQSGGQGQFADITVRFEPMEPGGGYEFKSEIEGGAVPREYIPGVMKGLEECMSNGVLAGFPVVDVRAVLVDGSYHDVDSSVLAFQLAARGAFRDGIKKAVPKMLEPIMKVEVVTPEEHLGVVIGDLNSRRGQINSFNDKPGGLKVVDALVPLAEMFHYVSMLRGMTKGRAPYTMQLAKFDVVPQHIHNQLAAKEEEVAA